MSVKIYREYRLKFYLNARHFILIDGKAGDIHPHTWEFSLIIRVGRGSFTQFNLFEKCINAYLAPYQNQLLNECKPFDVIIPTLEHIASCFSEEFFTRLEKVGGELIRMEVSESPTRSYILDIKQDYEVRRKKIEEKMLTDMVDTVLDGIL